MLLNSKELRCLLDKIGRERRGRVLTGIVANPSQSGLFKVTLTWVRPVVLSIRGSRLYEKM